ncbi:12100_t:CDS:2 [Acaulospora morrowiae]|uniref:12100_t:CDS:1 n=1 Tax=Acaulospora morrowiae TaxID=94023 RepID=A0A9N8YT63_9GLOM|nr:12100_t:CDS:2 [Acaulospora morrowiae]
MAISDRHLQYVLEPLPEPITYRYHLEVSQQPIRARMCGFGDKDRRPIDPPPVVRLLVSTADGTPVPESSVDHSMMIVHAGLWSEDSIEERSLVINPSSIPTQSTGPSSTVMSLNAPSSTRNLMGHCTSSAYVLNNHMGQQGIYFIFQDLSVRTEGSFTLKFSFCDVKELLVRRSLNGFPNTRGTVAAEVYSAPFKVYSAKKFPGMTESTMLSKAFAKQGIKIPIRKETRYRKPNNDDLREPSNDDAPEASSSVTSTNIDAPKASDSSVDQEGHTEEKRDHHDLSEDEETTVDEAEEEGKGVEILSRLFKSPLSFRLDLEAVIRL